MEQDVRGAKLKKKVLAFALIVLFGLSISILAMRRTSNQDLPPELRSLLVGGKLSEVRNEPSGHYSQIPFLSLPEVYRKDVYKFQVRPSELARRFRDALKPVSGWRVSDLDSFQIIYGGCVGADKTLRGKAVVSMLLCEDGEGSQVTVVDYSHRHVSWK